MNKNKEVPAYLKPYIKVANLSILNLDVIERIDAMGEKVLAVLKESHKRYRRIASWYFMVDDDAYVFVENLYKFTQKINTYEPKIYGFRFIHEIAQAPDGHVAGGPGNKD